MSKTAHTSTSSARKLKLTLEVDYEPGRGSRQDAIASITDAIAAQVGKGLFDGAGIDQVLAWEITDAQCPVRVRHWDEEQHSQDAPDYAMSVQDYRDSDRQQNVNIEVIGKEGWQELGAMVEIGSLRGNEDAHVPVLHLAFDKSNMAASFFRDETGYLIRPEADVALVEITLPDGSRGYRIPFSPEVD